MAPYRIHFIYMLLRTGASRMNRHYTDLKYRHGKWVPIWKYRRWAGWKSLEDLNLICETCEGFITGYGARFCSRTCHKNSYQDPSRGRLVERLADLIEAGEYDIDPLHVADAMLYWGGRTDPVRSLPWTRRRLEELT